MTYFYNLGLFFNQVANRYLDAPALRYAEDYYTYANLLSIVERLALFLISNQIEKGDVIAIANSKQPLSFALMLAALRLGVTYVNIDCTAPLVRNRSILEISKPKFVFVDDKHFLGQMYDLVESQTYRLIELSFEMLPAISEECRVRQHRLMEEVDASSVAYIMFTSGSTGTPKGVAVTHQNLLHFISWGKNCFEVKSDDIFANLSPMYFDNSVFDFYIALFSGASLAPIFSTLLSRPYDLVKYVCEMRCSIWFSVPSLLIYLMSMKAMNEVRLTSLRYIIFGGEGYPKIELKKLYDIFAKTTKLVNVYGPTECTCICSAYGLTDVDFLDLNGLPPLGKLNVNFDYLILDEQNNKVTKGELCLIGLNVAAGYYNDLERSAHSFITMHDPKYFMKRMYKTGDIVSEIDGILHFVGRKDNQIKHQGYRIELEEIEHALVKLPGVNQAAVIYIRIDSAYGKLIGFVASSQVINEIDLRQQLTNLIPAYMVPNKFIICDDLPKNANGKVNRNQLPSFYNTIQQTEKVEA